MEFKSAVSFLRSFASYENVVRYHLNGEHFDLEKFKKFLKDFNVCYEKLKYIHVGGSKGKGSLSNLLASYLSADSFKVGLFTTPYILSVRECFVINGEKISKNVLAKYISEVKKFLEKNPGKYNLSYFEILTAIAFKYFYDKKVDYAVMEVGIGGKRDATNVIVPEICALTKIEKEHTDILGKNLKMILKEKLGILKKGRKCVVTWQSDYVKKIMIEIAGEDQFIFVQDKIKIISQEIKNGKLIANFCYENRIIKDLIINPPGVAQLKNVLHFYVILRNLFANVDEQKFKAIVRNFKFLGRFDVRKIKRKTVVFDMAHTKASIYNLKTTLLNKFPGKKFVFLISVMKGKNVRAILKILSEISNKFIFTSSHKKRSMTPEDLNFIFKKTNKKPGDLLVSNDCRAIFYESVSSLSEDQILVVTGSHFLVREILKG